MYIPCKVSKYLCQTTDMFEYAVYISIEKVVIFDLSYFLLKITGY